MKRWLRRFLLTLYHTISFVWFAAAIIVVAMWIRSYWIDDGVQIGSRVTHTAAESPDGFVWKRIEVLDSKSGQIRWRAIDHDILDFRARVLAT